MVGSNYICKDCRYIWRTRKSYGRPGICPRCPSRKVLFDNVTNNSMAWIIGLTGTLLFILGKFNPSFFDSTFTNLSGLIGIPIFLIALLITLDQKQRNKKILDSLKKGKY